MKLFLATAFAACAFGASGVAAAPDADAVPTLPSYGVPPSKQYSGFLNASAVEDGTHLHYW